MNDELARARPAVTNWVELPSGRWVNADRVACVVPLRPRPDCRDRSAVLFDMGSSERFDERDTARLVGWLVVHGHAIAAPEPELQP